MGKTYKLDLPQNKEVTQAKVRIENGKVFVDVEFKEKFQPRDGDFLVSSFGNLFIYSRKPANNKLTYSSYCGVDRTGYIITEFSDNWTRKEGCRYANTEEKS